MLKPATRFAVPLADRFWDKVVKTDTCWLWTGAVTGDGVGVINSGPPANTPLLARRVAYALCVGPIPPGHQVTSSCPDSLCLRPDELRVGPPGARRRREAPVVERCGRGHERTAANTEVIKGKRWCRICKAAREANRPPKPEPPPPAPPRPTLTEADVREIRRLRREGHVIPALARRFGVGRGAISDIVHRRTHRHVADES